MKKDKTDSYSAYSESDNPEELCGGALWDVHCDYEQLEALSYAVKSSCQLGFEKVGVYNVKEKEMMYTLNIEFLVKS